MVTVSPQKANGDAHTGNARAICAREYNSCKASCPQPCPAGTTACGSACCNTATTVNAPFADQFCASASLSLCCSNVANEILCGTGCCAQARCCSGKCCAGNTWCIGGVCKVPAPGTPEACLARGALGKVCSTGTECSQNQACLGGCCVRSPSL